MSWWNGADGSTHHSHRGIALVGLQTQRILLDTAQLGEVIGVQFRPGGAHPFFAPPVDAFRDAHVALEDLWGAEARSLHDCVQSAPRVRDKFSSLERALLARACRALEPDPMIRCALAQLDSIPHGAVVRDLAHAASLTPKVLATRFSAQVGTRPKLYARIQRFRRVLLDIYPARRVPWTQLAVDWGYHDQSHFIRDFRAFSGFAPSEYDRLRGPEREHVNVPETEIRTSRA
jgi:AraC-like DNA-binding protein